MIGMRHVLVHGYFETDTELVKKVVDRDLPVLKTQLENILANMKYPILNKKEAGVFALRFLDLYSSTMKVIIA